MADEPRTPSALNEEPRDLYDEASQSLQVIVTSIDNIDRLLDPVPIRADTRGMIADNRARAERALTRLTTLLREHRCMADAKDQDHAACRAMVTAAHNAALEEAARIAETLQVPMMDDNYDSLTRAASRIRALRTPHATAQDGGTDK